MLGPFNKCQCGNPVYATLVRQRAGTSGNPYQTRRCDVTNHSDDVTLIQGRNSHHKFDTEYHFNTMTSRVPTLLVSWPQPPLATNDLCPAWAKCMRINYALCFCIRLPPFAYGVFAVLDKASLRCVSYGCTPGGDYNRDFSIMISSKPPGGGGW